MKRSRALAFNHDLSVFLIFWPTHPHLLEGSQRTQNWPSYPRWSLDFCCTQNLDFHILRRDVSHLSLKSLFHIFEHTIAASNNYTCEKIAPDVDIRSTNSFCSHCLETCKAFNCRVRGEKGLWNCSSFTSHCQDCAIRQFKVLLSNLLNSVRIV